MSRYDSTLTSFVLKTQPLAEADLLVTWFSKEAGKVRSVVVGARRAHSRLAFTLQPGVVARIRLVGRNTEQGLLRLAGGEVVRTYVYEYTEAQALCLAWFLELILRATVDAEKNLLLFSIAEQFFSKIALAKTADALAALAVHVLIQVLAALGLMVHEEKGRAPTYFSVSAGGFFFERPGLPDEVIVSSEVWQRYKSLKAQTILDLESAPATDLLLLEWLGKFVEYRLDRQIRSHKLFSDIIHRET